MQNYRAPATVENQQRSETEEVRLESNDPTSRLTWTVGAFWQLSREYSLEEIHDPMLNNLLETLYGQNALDIFGEALLPNGDSYYNPNTAHDRQIAGFGEATYSITDQLKLTLGGRVAKTSFDITHFTDGPQNEGPIPVGASSASQSETPFTPKAGLSYQMDPNNLFYFTYAKGFRVGGANAPLPTYCMDGLIQEGYTSGQAPATYKSDSTQSYEIGSKNNFDNVLKIASSVYYIKWNDIQQNVYVNSNCGLQFTDNLGTAVAKGFDLQADAALGRDDARGGHWLHRCALRARPPRMILRSTAMQFPDRPRSTAARARIRRGTCRSGRSTTSPCTRTRASRASTMNSQAATRGLRQFRIRAHRSTRHISVPRSRRRCPRPRSCSFAPARVLNGWQVSFFIDNLLNTHVTTNYERTLYSTATIRTYPPPGPQYNFYTFRPRTFGITATLHL